MKSKKEKTLLIEQLRKMPIVEIACSKTNVSRATFYRWKKNDPEFAKEVTESIGSGRSFINDLAESQLIGAVKDRNLSAIMYWLKHHHEDYRNRLEIEGNINTIEELSPEQKILVGKALKLASLKFYGKD